MHRLAFALCCALSLTACFDLPEVDSDECGNGVLERGEDCDSQLAFDEGGCGDPAVVEDEELACRFQCQTSACPTGWRCGGDFICRQPSGTFSDTPTTWDLPADQFAIGDVDGDGNNDLIGNDDNAITVRFGEGDGDFDSSFEFGIRRPTGPVVYGRLGRDELLDAVVPIEDGLFVLRGDISRTLQPVTYTPFSTGDADASFVGLEMNNPLQVFTQVLFMAHAFGVMSFISCQCEEKGNPGTCDACEEDLPPGDAPLGRPLTASIDGDPRDELVLYREGAELLYVYDTAGEPSADNEGASINPYFSHTINLPEGWTLAPQTPVFAQVDGAGGPDLVLQVYAPIDPDRPSIAVSYNTGGTLGVPDLVDTFDIKDEEDEVLFRAMPLAAGDYNGDDVDDFVLPIGLVLTIPGAGAGLPPTGIFPVMFANGVLWADATFGDFNADSAIDFAVASVDDVGLVSLDGVDIYIQPEAGPPNRFHVDSARPPRQSVFGGSPRSFVTGDFDGDLVDDLAFVGNSAVEPNETVSVVFGARDAGFDDAVDMGRLTIIQHVFPVSLPISLASLDSITDLFIESENLVVEDDGAVAELREGISIMLGDSSRRMVSPLVLSTALLNPGPPLAAHQPRRVGLGDFNQDQANDIVALAVGPEYDNWNKPTTDTDEAAPTVSSVWYLPAGFDDSTIASDGDDPLQHPIARKIRDAGELALACSTWAAVDLHQDDGASDAHPADELVGLDDVAECRDGDGSDGIPNLVVVEIFPLEDEMEDCEAGSYPFCFTFGSLGDELAYPETVSAGDMNSNGTLDAAVLFRGSADFAGVPGEEGGEGGGAPDSSIEQQAGVGILWNQAGELEGANYDTVATSAPPSALASIWLDVNESRDLAILTSDGVQQARFDEESGTFATVAEGLIGTSYAASAMAAGDLDGDGIEDLAVVVGDTVYVYLQQPLPPLGTVSSATNEGSKDDPTQMEER